MTPDPPPDVWSHRRRWGEVLIRWSGRSNRAADTARRRPRWWACWQGRLRGRDRGAATIFVLAVGLVLVAAGGAGAAVGAARIGRHQAQVAAGMGALAGAMHAIEGASAACAAAARYVAANGAGLSSCEASGLEIVVSVDVEVSGLPGPSRRAHATARAGPVTAVGR